MKRQRVLVVDDNPDALVSMCKALAVLGHDCHVARDGHDALIAARRVRPDVVLLDIGLPGLDGFAVARLLRQEPDLSGVRIIAVTGHASEEDRARATEAGIDYHLVKPVDPVFLDSLFGGWKGGVAGAA